MLMARMIVPGAAAPPPGELPGELRYVMFTFSTPLHRCGNTGKVKCAAGCKICVLCN